MGLIAVVSWRQAGDSTKQAGPVMLTITYMETWERTA